MSKRGRPKSKEPIREVQYRLRITPEEHKFLKETSENTGLPISHLIRIGVLAYREQQIYTQMFSSERRVRHSSDRIKELLNNTKKHSEETTDEPKNE